MMQQSCDLVGRVFAFCETPGGRERLERFLDQKDACLDTDDVVRITKWSRDHVNRLCQTKRLPHIPGKPHTFVYSDLMAAIRRMQVGGDFGRRKAAKKAEK